MSGANRTGIVLLTVLLAAAAGCARSLNGTFEDSAGLTVYEFQRDGNVVMSVLGTRVRGRYELQGDRVLIDGPQGTVILLRKGADALSGPTGLELSRTRGQ